MRIAVFADRFPAISESFILRQIVGLIDAGVDVDIFANLPGAEPKEHPDIQRYRLRERVLYFRIPATRAGTLVRGAALLLPGLARQPARAAAALDPMRFGSEALGLRLFQQVHALRFPRRYDVLHAHFGTIGAIVERLRRAGALAGPLVTSFHGSDLVDDERGVRRRQYRELFRHGDAFTVNSEFSRGRLSALGAPTDRIELQPMGVDCDRWAQVGRRPAGDDLRVCSIARLVEVKGIEFAIRAIGELRSLRPNLELRYTIVGDGPLREHLHRVADACRVADICHFAGWLAEDEVRAVLAEADILLMAGVRAGDGAEEGAGVIALEAQAAGLPVVATRVGGVPEMLAPANARHLVPERDPQALARALLDLSDRRDEWPAIGAEGREHVRRSFDARGLTARLLDLYAGLRGEAACLAGAL